MFIVIDNAFLGAENKSRDMKSYGRSLHTVNITHILALKHLQFQKLGGGGQNLGVGGGQKGGGGEKGVMPKSGIHKNFTASNQDNN